MVNLELKNIFISSVAGQPMESVISAVVDGGGIVGDRYHIDSGGVALGTHSIRVLSKGGRIPNQHRVATIFSDGDFESSLNQFNQILIDKGLDPMKFTPAMMRRNFYVSAELGLLNEMLAANETLGFNGSGLQFAPIEKCIPCNLPPTYIVDPKRKLRQGMMGYSELVATQSAFKSAFAETAGIRVGIIEPGRATI